MSPLQRLARLIFVSSVLVLTASGWWLATFAMRVERQEARSTLKADAIIVLTGGADRIEDGLALFEAGHGRRVLISGVNQHVSMETLRRRWPGHDAAFACCVDLDFRALNTFENARESADWMRANGFASVLLVTASYHMPRARLEFIAAMPDRIILPVPVIPDARRLSRWWLDPTLGRIMVSEAAKYALARLRLALRVFS